MNTTLVLADDHHVVRQALKTLIEAELDCTVVGEAADGIETIELVERLKPTVLIVDLLMPRLNGMDVIRHLHKHMPGLRIIVLSMHAEESYVREALRCGANGYVLKESKASEFVQAIREVLAGQRYLSPTLSDRMIDAYLQQSDTDELDPYTTLTPREQEILHLSVQGQTASKIATQLSISIRTVESYRATMMRKLGLRTQTDLVRYAIRRRIIPLEEQQG